MLFPRHPQPVALQKPVAMLLVQQRQETKSMDKHLLIIPAGPVPKPSPQPPIAPED